MIMQVSICRRFDSQRIVFAAFLALFNAGNKIDTRSAIMPMTTRSSTSVNPVATDRSDARWVWSDGDLADDKSCKQTILFDCGTFIRFVLNTCGSMVRPTLPSANVRALRRSTPRDSSARAPAVLAVACRLVRESVASDAPIFRRMDRRSGPAGPASDLK